MSSTTLQAILAAKEQRAEIRAGLLQNHSVPVLTFSINKPGQEKNSPFIRQLLKHALDGFRTRSELLGIEWLEERVVYSDAGPFAVVAVAGEPARLKQIALELEDGSDFGRLLDIDVYAADGVALSRQQLGRPPRACLACSEMALLCMRSGKHTAAEIESQVQRRLGSFSAHATRIWPQEVETITEWALESMLAELACTPAPGLVDRQNSGAHTDMDFFTFIKSTASLSITMSRCAAAGFRHKGDFSELLPVLRAIGCDGDRRMLRATNGVNTQKGLIFLLGILSAAAATLKQQNLPLSPQHCCRTVGEICQGIVARELEPLRSNQITRRLTAGERLFLQYGATGIRGEMERALPSVLQSGLPGFKSALSAGSCLNDALVHALLSLMTVVEDTTILHRHDESTLREVQQASRQILSLGGMLTDEGKAAVFSLDQEFIARRISPGGSADLLAATHFLWLAEHS